MKTLSILILFMVIQSWAAATEPIPSVQQTSKAIYDEKTSEILKKDKKENKEPSDAEKKKYYDLMQPKAKNKTKK